MATKLSLDEQKLEAFLRKVASAMGFVSQHVDEIFPQSDPQSDTGKETGP